MDKQTSSKFHWAFAYEARWWHKCRLSLMKQQQQQQQQQQHSTSSVNVTLYSLLISLCPSIQPSLLKAHKAEEKERILDSAALELILIYLVSLSVNLDGCLASLPQITNSNFRYVEGNSGNSSKHFQECSRLLSANFTSKSELKCMIFLFLK
uniref:Uncharacterized protein n=1 Tax=Glossina brevipalpis TaxID=37001 RepID=A0A1A9WSV9_9MUSC